MKILHIIQQVSLGGATRCMWNIAKYSARLGNFQHRVISLLPAEPADLRFAELAGATVLNAPATDTLHAEITAADVVHFHLWNNPDIYALMRSDLPPMRAIFWWHVAGDQPPQVISRELINYPDLLVVTGRHTYELPIIQNLPAETLATKIGIVYGAADFERLSNFQRKPHATFNVGYLGSVHFAKMHSNYVPMSAAIDIPNVQFLICGLGAAVDVLKQQSRDLAAEDRFVFKGYVEDIKSAIEDFDIFGYPLCPENYSTSELVLEEVMFTGIPPVIFPYGGAQRTVTNNRTGYIVQSELEYRQAIEYLYRYPEERQRLGQGAHEYAVNVLGAHNSAVQFNAFYEELVKRPKRLHTWPASAEGAPPLKWPGADNFLQSLGETAPQFRSSLYSRNNSELLEADRLIARSSPTLCNPGGGGLFHYQVYFPNDPYLHLWTGLVAFEHQRYKEAKTHFRTAIRLGGRHWRFYWYWLQSKFRTLSG